MTHSGEVFRLLWWLADRNRHFQLMIYLLLTWKKRNRDKSPCEGPPSSPLNTETSQTNEIKDLERVKFDKADSSKRQRICFDIPKWIFAFLILIPEFTKAELWKEDKGKETQIFWIPLSQTVKISEHFGIIVGTGASRIWNPCISLLRCQSQPSS